VWKFEQIKDLYPKIVAFRNLFHRIYTRGAKHDPTPH